MKIAGQAVLEATPEKVWEALNDPAVLAQCIPGCQSLEQVGDDEFKMTVSAGVASIRGIYDGSVQLTDKQPPNSYVLKATGSGGPGTVSATCQISLTAADGGCKLSYDADAIIGGVIAGVGQRMITGVAKKLAGEYFGNLNDFLTGKATPITPAPQAVTSGSPTSQPDPGATQVFSGRVPMKTSGESFDVTSVLAGAAIALGGVLIGAAVVLRARR